MYCTCVCVCVCVCVWLYRFYQVFLVGPVWPHWLPRVGSLPHHSRPTVQARGICVPVLPLDQCVMHLGQNLARCPRATLEVGRWLRGFRRPEGSEGWVVYSHTMLFITIRVPKATHGNQTLQRNVGLEEVGKDGHFRG